MPAREPTRKTDWAVFHWWKPIAKPRYVWADERRASDGWDSAKGYEEERRWLLDSDPGSDFTIYEPLKAEPTLFRVFAGLEPTESRFQGFADDYGALGFDVSLDAGGPARKGEPFSRWKAEWKAIRNIVEVLGAVNQRDVKRLAGWIQVTGDKAAFVRRTPRELAHGSIIAIRDDDIWHESMKRENGQVERLMRLATFWIQRLVNERLNGDLTNGTHVRPRLLFHVDQGEFVLQIVPSSLIGVLWLQCALAIEGDLEYRRCAWCRQWILLSPEGEGRRRHTKYCSSSCKLKAHRERHRPVGLGG